jgi:selenocysteine lyase/cysteine desulfurase
MRALTVKKQHPVALEARLHEEHRVEIPAYEWEGMTLVRFSIGPYNDEEDVDRLVEAFRLAL